MPIECLAKLDNAVTEQVPWDLQTTLLDNDSASPVCICFVVGYFLSKDFTNTICNLLNSGPVIQDEIHNLVIIT